MYSSSLSKNLVYDPDLLNLKLDPVVKYLHELGISIIKFVSFSLKKSSNLYFDFVFHVLSNSLSEESTFINFVLFLLTICLTFGNKFSSKLTFKRSFLSLFLNLIKGEIL
ncbi:Uncharacterised protein [Chlamydia trachomatis]|nr:Uncharacterised protein [Chlamydia trachomatis]CRH48403.1 Uncharacterised protein [Chlamydia trachomatis]CRH55306.1 Uncharacterised protein [Chlamydia trachomatis]